MWVANVVPSCPVRVEVATNMIPMAVPEFFFGSR